MREVDVALAAGAGQRLAAHEEEAVLPDRGRTEVVCRRVDRLTEVLRASPRRARARAGRHPDVEPAPSAGPVRRQVEAQPVGRLDRTPVE